MKSQIYFTLHHCSLTRPAAPIHLQLTLVCSRVYKSGRPASVLGLVLIDCQLFRTPPFLTQTRTDRLSIWSIIPAGHLRSETGYEALRQLAQNDPILQRSFQKLLRVRYVLLRRAEDAQRYQPGYGLLLWIHGSTDRSSPKSDNAKRYRGLFRVGTTHPHFCFKLKKKRKKRKAAVGGQDALP